jgi:hypothetical protein
VLEWRRADVVKKMPLVKDAGSVLERKLHFRVTPIHR